MKLEYGKKYILNDGTETGALRPSKSAFAHEYPFICPSSLLSWREDGTQYLNKNFTGPFNISREAPAAIPVLWSLDKLQEIAQTTDWQITAGTYVKLRNGDKAWVVGARLNGGWVVESKNRTFVYTVDHFGCHFDTGPAGSDIIGPWVEPPKMERKTVTRWVAVNKEGNIVWDGVGTKEYVEKRAKEIGGEVVELTGTTAKEYPIT